MSSKTTKNTKVSFDEFKLFYESTEKVTDRRLSANTWNYSICIAIVVAIASIITWSAKNAPFFYVGLLPIFVLSIMAILFCSLWTRQIADFKYLNNAKFKVLNDMAPHIEFDVSHPNQLTSFCPFEKEWQKMEEVKAAVEVGQHKIIALKSSSIELFIPKAFKLLFSFINVSILIVIIFNWNSFINAWKSILHAQ